MAGCFRRKSSDDQSTVAWKLRFRRSANRWIIDKSMREMRRFERVANGAQKISVADAVNDPAGSI